MAVTSYITPEIEDRAYIIMDAVLMGLMPSVGIISEERPRFVMLSNTKDHIFIPVNKDLMDEQKGKYMETIARASGNEARESGDYMSQAFSHPETIPSLLTEIHSGVIKSYTRAIDRGGKNNDEVLARIENVRRNNLLLPGVLEYVGFPKELAEELAEKVNLSLDAIKHYAEPTNDAGATQNPEENGRE